MGNLSLTFLPPQYPEEFEKFVRGVVDIIWEQQGWHPYGRKGQKQHGIDIFGYDNRGVFTAFQCKKKSQTNSNGEILTISLLTDKVINDEIEAAEKFDDPPIGRLVFATTSPTDASLQSRVMALNVKRKKDKKFPVDIWFWDDFQVYIERHIELMNWYYSEYLEKIKKYDKNIHILTLLRQAFTRPAFRRLIGMEESGADFIQAIKNTQEAITTGMLYNRRGDLIATSYDYQKMSNPQWKKEIQKIYNHLDQVREIYQKGLLSKQITEHPTCLEIHDRYLSDQFNIIRRDCLSKLNKVLEAAHLEKVQSELTS